MQPKQVAFRLAAIALPIVLLLTVEFVLRIAGVGQDARTPFRDIPGQSDYLAFNPEFAKKYFDGFQPAVAFDPFLSEKPDSVFRVFVLGGSSTVGFPYSFYYGFPARLQARLEAQSPSMTIEVVNLGMTAVNSFTIWDLRHAVVDQRPDAVVIYAGHNEYYGAFGAGSTIYQLGNRVWMKRLLIRLKGTALYSLVAGALAPDPTATDQESPQVRTLMARVVGDRTIKFDDEVFRAGVEQFERNMASVLDVMTDNDVPVYVGTVVSNLAGQAPLGDDSAAVASYSLGIDRLKAGDSGAAREAFLEAKEMDDVRFRAPERINEVIRSLAEKENVYLVEIGPTFRQRSISGIEDNSLFDDHLHPNYVGYDLIADQFHQALLATPRFSELRAFKGSDAYEIDPFERSVVAAQLARLKSGYPFVKGRTPEQEAAAYKAVMDRLFYEGSFIDSLAVLAVAELEPPYSLLRQAIQKAKANQDTLSTLLLYRSLLYWQPFNSNLIQEAVSYAANSPNYLDEVAALARFGANRSTDLYYANVLAAVRIRQGRFEDADFVLGAIEEADPSSRAMLFNRARLLVLQGDTVLARSYYGRYTGEIPSPDRATALQGEVRDLITAAVDALRQGQFLRGLALADTAAARRPGLADAAFVRGRLLFEMERLDEAASAFRNVIAIDPEYPGVWHNLGNVYFRDKRYQDAVSAYRREARSRPEARAWHAVGGAYWQLGESDSSRLAYQRAIQLDSTYAPAIMSLAEWYEASGDYSQALRHARGATRFDPNNADYRYMLGALLAKTEKFDQAVPVLENVVKERPWDFSALFNLGQALQRLGRQEEGRAVLNRAAEVQEEQREVNRLRTRAGDFPDSFEARLEYANALRQSGRIKESIDQYLIAEAMRPNNLQLRTNTATAMLQIGDTTEALRRYRSILAQDSTIVEAWLNLYVFYDQTGNQRRSREALDRAVAIDPDHPMIDRIRNR